jgi:hypothetical protein
MDENPYRAPESFEGSSSSAVFERLVNGCAIVVAGPIAAAFVGMLVLVAVSYLLSWLAGGVD